MMHFEGALCPRVSVDMFAEARNITAMMQKNSNFEGNKGKYA
jgi:hypothetical protein